MKATFKKLDWTNVITIEGPIPSENFPIFTLEKFTTGKYEIMQIDSIHEVDNQSQELIIAGTARLPIIDINGFHEELELLQFEHTFKRALEDNLREEGQEESLVERMVNSHSFFVDAVWEVAYHHTYYSNQRYSFEDVLAAIKFSSTKFTVNDMSKKNWEHKVAGYLVDKNTFSVEIEEETKDGIIVPKVENNTIKILQVV